MAVTIEEVYRSKRNDTNTATIILAKLMCDTASDLPSQSGLTGYILAQGCKADVISENKTYKIDSSGNWHISGGEMWQNVYTQSEIDALLDDKQDELTVAQLDAVNSGITAAKLTEYETAKGEDRAALVQQVDEGAKNRMTINSGSSTPPARWINIPVNIEAGKYYVYFGTLASDDTDAGTCQACFLDSNSVQVSNWLSFGRGSNVFDDATLSGEATIFRLYPSNSYANSAGDTVTFTNGMICTASDWTISQKFVPYRPTWQEMYEMIQALQ